MLIDIAIIAGFLAVGSAAGYFLIRRQNKSIVSRMSESESALVRSAQNRAESIRKDTERRLQEVKKDLHAELEKYIATRGKELDEFMQALQVREARSEAKKARVDAAEKALEEQFKTLDSQEATLKALEDELKALNEQWLEALQERAGMTAEEAKAEYLKNKVEDIQLDIQRERFMELEDLKENVEQVAKSKLDTAIMRCEASVEVERLNYAVEFPSEKIRQKAQAAGEEWLAKIKEVLEVEATWTEDGLRVFLSSQDSIAREVARRTVLNCIAQSKFNAEDTGKFIKRIQGEVEKNCNQAAEELVRVTNIGKVAQEVKSVIGRLRFRTSYTQNQWYHAIEVSNICGILAAELGFNQRKARRAGAFHDLGKAVDFSIEGSHALIGAEILRRNGEDEEVANAVASHHHDEQTKSPFAFLVVAGDSISGARPGARHERAENYFDRLRDLERIAREVKGVAKVFALQAGRELRVYVDNRRVSDEECQTLAETIAKKVEDNLVYPGQIQITVIRETVISNYAN